MRFESSRGERQLGLEQRAVPLQAHAPGQVHVLGQDIFAKSGEPLEAGLSDELSLVAEDVPELMSQVRPRSVPSP